jgi:hypothetical protein
MATIDFPVMSCNNVQSCINISLIDNKYFEKEEEFSVIANVAGANIEWEGPSSLPAVICDDDGE